MRCVILANGEYGDLGTYKTVFAQEDIVICADGGANYAYQMNIVPYCIIGDMDSILPEVKEFFIDKGVLFKKYSRHKDFTDTQLALSIVTELGAAEVLFLGTIGKRLDHTLSNLFSSLDIVQQGIKLTHLGPDCRIHIINNPIEIDGQKGDIVSVLALTDEAAGVSETGFEYPLHGVVLEKNNPYAISNIMTGKRGIISLDSGILAVIHYY